MVELFAYGYVGLFIAGFLAATILPLSSEALLSLFLYSDYDLKFSVAVITMGNWLGGLSTYGLGYMGKWHWIEKWLHVKRERVEWMQQYLYRRGSLLAFFAWLPFIGDLIPLALGFLRSYLPGVALFMLLGKGFRYLIWAWLTIKMIG